LEKVIISKVGHKGRNDQKVNEGVCEEKYCAKREKGETRLLEGSITP